MSSSGIVSGQDRVRLRPLGVTRKYTAGQRICGGVSVSVYGKREGERQEGSEGRPGHGRRPSLPPRAIKVRHASK